MQPAPTDPPIAPRLFTLKQGAVYVGVSYWTFRDLVLNGTVPSVRVPSGRINSGRNHGKKRQTRVLVPAADPRVRSLRKVLVDRLDLDRLIESWKDAPGPSDCVREVASVHGEGKNASGDRLQREPGQSARSSHRFRQGG